MAARPPEARTDSANSHGFVAVSLVSFVAATAFTVAVAWGRNGGHWVYVLDDSYIHMAMARTFADSFEWGVVPEGYEAASSSPAWTLLLAGAFRLVPFARDWLPLVLATAAGAAVLALVGHEPLCVRLAPLRAGRALASVVPFVLFLPALAAMGLEHAAHALLAVAALRLLAQVTSSAVGGRTLAGYYVLLGLAPLVRVEGAFLVAGCVTALAVEAIARRRTVLVERSALSAVAGLVPLAAMAAINLSHDQYALPNSVMAKSRLATGGMSEILPNAGAVVRTLLTADPLVTAPAVGAVVYLAFAARGRIGRHVPECVAFLVTVALHAGVASFGNFHRYHAYLVIIGVFVTVRLLGEVVPDRTLAPAALALTTALLLMAIPKAPFMVRLPIASGNIHAQQYQMGRFLATSYGGRAVAVNDLGAVSYLHRGPVVDLRGVGTREVLTAIRDDRADRTFYRGLAERREVAVVAVYAESLPGAIPTEWTRVGSWTLRGTVITPAYRTVVFYATSADEVGALRSRLCAFEPHLPDSVDVSIIPSGGCPHRRPPAS